MSHHFALFCSSLSEDTRAETAEADAAAASPSPPSALPATEFRAHEYEYIKDYLPGTTKPRASSTLAADGSQGPQNTSLSVSDPTHSLIPPPSAAPTGDYTLTECPAYQVTKVTKVTKIATETLDV